MVGLEACWLLLITAEDTHTRGLAFVCTCVCVCFALCFRTGKIKLKHLAHTSHPHSATSVSLATVSGTTATPVCGEIRGHLSA